MLVDEWEVWAGREKQNADSTLKAYRREIELLTEFAAGDVVHLSPEQIETWMRSRGGGDKTAARRWSALKSFFSFLVARTKGLDGNPMDHISRAKIPPSTPRSIQGIDARIGRLDEPHRSIAILIHESAMLYSEIRSIKRKPVRDEVRVAGGRRARERRVPLTRAAQDALRVVMRALPGGKWPAARTVQKHFEAEGLSANGLRNTLAGELFAADADVGVVQGIFGHLSPATTARYMAAFARPKSISELRDALERRRS